MDGAFIEGTIVLTPYMKLRGIFAAITTPFDFKGDLYPAKVQHNVEKWNRTALSGYVVCSLAGEGALLAAEEKIAMWEMVARHAAPESILIADPSVEGVKETVALANRAAELGYKAILCAAPRTNHADVALYFRSVADRSNIPVIVRTERGATLSSHPNIVGALQTGDFQSSAKAARTGFQFLNSSDSGVWEALQAGAHGAVLDFASAAPYATIAIWEAFRTREEDAGLDWQARIAHPGTLVSEIYGVSGLKYAMDLNGYYGGPPRLPLSSPDSAAKSEIEEAFRNLKG